MKIKYLGNESDGTRSVEIRAGELSYRALLRCIHKIPGAVISDATHDPMNDNTKINIKYKDANISIETPFSDYIVNCPSPSSAFDQFVSMLSNYRVKWWEHFL